MNTVNPRRGYLLGLSAYLIRGLFPLYFKAIEQVPALEIVVHRIICSAIFGAALLLLWKHPGWWSELRSNPSRLAVLTLSGTLIATNWLVYVWSVVPLWRDTTKKFVGIASGAPDRFVPSL